MMTTLLGDAISDGLDDGNIVSGVGGQYNFVAQAHQLPTARSVLMLRSWRAVTKPARWCRTLSGVTVTPRSRVFCATSS